MGNYGERIITLQGLLSMAKVHYSYVLYKVIASPPSLESFNAFSWFFSISPEIQKKYQKIQEKLPTIASEVARNFSYIKKMISNETSSLNEADILFISTLIAGNRLWAEEFKQESTKQIKAIFNGYMSPYGNHFINIFSRTPLIIEAVTPIQLQEYQDQKERLAPFRAIMLFQDIGKVVIGKLKNLLPRTEILSGTETLTRLRQDIVTWAQETGFTQTRIEDLVKGDYVNLAWRALSHIEASDYDKILIYGKFLSLLFFHDDDGDNFQALKQSEGTLNKLIRKNESLIDIFKGNISTYQASADPVVKAAIEIMERVIIIQSEAPVVNVNLLSREMGRYLSKSSEESQKIKDQTILTEGYYLEHLRPFTSSLYACFALSAILQKIEVPDVLIAEGTPGGDLIKTGNMHVAIANDIISYPKEITQEAISLVLLKLLQKAKDCSLIEPDKCFLDKEDLKVINSSRPEIIKQAVEEVILTLNTYMAAYEQGISRIPAELQVFEEKAVRPWLTGNGDWQDQSSERYRKKLGLTGPIEECTLQLTSMGYHVIDISNQAS